MMTSTDAAPVRSQKVWDWTVRTFHWGLVFLIACMWSTAEGHGIWETLDGFMVEQGWIAYGWGDMGWHRRIGMLVLFLWFYRVYWALFGASTAKFSDFVKGPGKVIAYVKSLTKGNYKPSTGHSPLGALSVVALILVVGTQVGTGLFTIDVNGLESGPLSKFLEFDTGRLFSEFHEMSFRALYILIALHVLAVLAYQFVLKANLVRPMLTGSRKAEEGAPEKTVRAPLWNVALGVAIAIGLTWLVWTV